MSPPSPSRILLSLLLLVAGCGAEREAATEGALHAAGSWPAPPIPSIYETRVRPPSADPHSEMAPETFRTEEGLVHKLVSYTRVYELDGIYRSMQGPRSLYAVDISGSFPETELLWVRGMAAQVVDESGEALSQEFMCHMVASVAAPKRADAHEPRIATLSQGLYHTEYPAGLGVPVLSSEPLLFNSQVLNQNHEEIDLRVRHRIVTLFIRDRDLVRPMGALTSAYAQIMVLVDGEPGEGYFGVSMPDEEVHGPSCAVGHNAAPDAGTIDDGLGRSFSPHWVVEPGRVTNHTLATRQLQVGYDTTIHSIDVHLHPFAESIQLVDLTTDETLFTSRARGVERGIGLFHVETFSSEEGIPIYADHEYGVVSIYDNPTGENQDAMAVLYLGLRDRDFDPGPPDPSEAGLRRRVELARQVFEKRRQPLRLGPPDPLRGS